GASRASLEPRTNLRKVVPAAERIGEVFDRDVQFVLIAPVVIDNAIGRIGGPIESVFAIVVPDRRSTNQGDCPEASTGVAVGMLLPFLRVDSNCVPKTLLRLGHPRVSLTDRANSAASDIGSQSVMIDA